MSYLRLLGRGTHLLEERFEFRLVANPVAVRCFFGGLPNLGRPRLVDIPQNQRYVVIHGLQQLLRPVLGREFGHALQHKQ